MPETQAVPSRRKARPKPGKPDLMPCTVIVHCDEARMSEIILTLAAMSDKREAQKAAA